MKILNYIFLSSIMIFLWVQFAAAQSQIEITPGISIGEEYNDNIYLDRTNEKSDYITTVSPSFSLNVVSERNNLSFKYAPGIVRYYKDSQNNTIRHSGTISFYEDLTEHLRFELNDTYLKSEEPIEETEGIAGVRRNRNVYQRNSGKANIRYIFGKENNLELGYKHSLLKNEDITLDDGKIFDPFARVTYWFNQKNGIELNSGYTYAEFTSDDISPPADTYSGNNLGIRYIYRFSAHSSFALGADTTKRNFNGLTRDYRVNEGTITFNHAFSSDFSIEASGGYFIQKRENSDDESGYKYSLSLVKDIEKGRFTLTGNSGWSENYLDPEARGFTRYWGADAGFQYSVTENLSNQVGISFRRDKDPDNQKAKIVGANYGWTYSFARWYSLSLNYSCSSRDDDLDEDDYIVNRVMITLGWSKPFRL